MILNLFRRGVVAAFAFMFVCVAAHGQWTWTPQTGRWVNLKRLPKETDQLQIDYARSLLLEEKPDKALRETSKFTKFYGDSSLADENQYLRGEIRMSTGDYRKAAQEFQQLISAYPDTGRYNDAIAKQYEIGDMLYEKGLAKLDKRWTFYRHRPLRRAADIYTMVVDNQPFTAAAAEAQYKVGLCQYTREQYVEAAFEYRRVVEDYAGSDWVDEASHGLAMCYYNLSLPPAYDQTPSQLTMDAIDSFSSRYPSDERVADLKDKRQEMYHNIAEQRLQTARFYEKRRSFDAARISFAVVVEQFPDTPAAEEARNWLERYTTPEGKVRKDVLEAQENS